MLVVALAVTWLGVRAGQAANHLQSLRGDVSRIRADLLDGRNARPDLARAQHDAHAARADTHDPLWWALSWLPPIRTVRGLAQVSDDLARRDLPPIVSVGSSLQPSRLRIAHNQIALQPLVAAAPALEQADAATQHGLAQVHQLPGGWFEPVSSARSKVIAQLTSLAGSVDAAARFSQVGPAMLGADGPRRYFVGIQNNAESRGTGGLVAAYAIVVADHGRVRVVQRGPDNSLRNAPHAVVDLGPEFTAAYGGYDATRLWDDSNLSPNFPDAANIWAHLWQRQSGQQIDGAFAIDPVGLADLLGATGPAPVSVRGSPQQFTASNLAAFIESGQYAEFAPEGPQRKGFVSRVAGAVLGRLLSGSGEPSALVSAMGHAAGGGHLALWSAQPSEQAMISGTPLAGELPSTTAPFASLTVDNGAATKLDYYLERSLTYSASSCSADRSATVMVQLRNTAPPGLPAYVDDTAERPKGVGESEPLIVFVHVTQGDYLASLTLDGQPQEVTSYVEAGHPTYGLRLTIQPGQTRTLLLRLVEPRTHGAAQTQLQPLAHQQLTRLGVPDCRS